MTDVLDEVIKRLPASTLNLILNFKGNVGESDNQNHLFTELLQDFQKIKISETNRELRRKIADIKLRTAENKKVFRKIQNELEVVKCLNTTPINTEGVDVYAEKINDFKQRLRHIAKDHDDVDLLQLFKDIECLNLQIEEYKKKVSEEKAIYECYDGFPPDIIEGKRVIARIKEKITKEKLSKSVINSLFQP